LKYTNPTLLDHLASTYVLGTLAGGARRRFERLLSERHDLRLLVGQWEQRLAQLAASVPPQQPSPDVWKRIEQRTRGKAKPWGVFGSFGIPLVPVFSGLGGLLGGVVLCGALLLAFPTLLISVDQLAMRAGERLPQSYVGLLVDENANGKVLLSSLRHGRTATIKAIGPITPPAQGHLILWALPPQGPALRIGEVPAKGSAEFEMAQSSEQLLAKVSKLVVTLEDSVEPQQIGSRIVFTGNCAKLW
jgi:anti-sigma-K factor RskA